MNANHPDFGTYNHIEDGDKGVVDDKLGEDGKPVFVEKASGYKTLSSKKNFDTWFNYHKGINNVVQKTFMMKRHD